jgi:putative lipoic acid-binding regulatory protein
VDPEAARPIDATLIDTMSQLARRRKASEEASARLGGVAPPKTPTTTVMASAESDEKWKELDARVNEYPSERKFQAIGSDPDGTFVESIKSVISMALDGRVIHPENVSGRASSGGKYVSANVTCEMRSGEEVIAVYKALKADPRVLWYL